MIYIPPLEKEVDSKTLFLKTEEFKTQAEEIFTGHQMLELQIAKLQDDEYIAKLARKEYFLSEEGEIIFTIPKESDKKDDDEQ